MLGERPDRALGPDRLVERRARLAVHAHQGLTMNAVWTTALGRASCGAVRRPTQTQPLLQLFNGYAKYRRCITSSSVSAVSPGVRGAGSTSTSPRHAFSTSAALQARAKVRSPPPPKKQSSEPVSASKLSSAPTIALHTEGVTTPSPGEELTWRYYDPEGGMPLPNGDLSQPTINGIFGNEDVDVETGNYIVNVMHWRRMSGALIDSGLDFPRAREVTREQALKALAYVRTLDLAFDESEAGQRWAEEESLRLQEELVARSVKLGLLKPVEGEEYAEEEEDEQGSMEGRERTGTSALQQHREEREAQWETKQAADKAAAEAQELATLHSTRGPLELVGGVQPSVALAKIGATGITIGRGAFSVTLDHVERQPWVKYYEKQSETIVENMVPQYSIARRLGPALAFLLFVLAAGAVTSKMYTPPPKSARIWPDMKPAVATLTTLSGVLVASFLLNRIPPLWRFFNMYCTTVAAKPYAFSLVGALFRHASVYHLGVNLTTLWLIGPTLHDDVGRGTFLAIFFATGATGSFVSLTNAVLRAEWGAWAVGCSGSVLGLLAATCTLRPNRTISVLGVELPIAAWLILTLVVAQDAFALIRGRGRTPSGVDHWGHIGGMVSGVGFATYLQGHSIAATTELAKGEGSDLMVAMPKA